MVHSMTAICKLISAWLMALIVSLLFPLMGLAAVSGTTYDLSYTTMTAPVTIAESTAAIEPVGCGETSLQSMANRHAWSLLGLNRILDAPKGQRWPGKTEPVAKLGFEWHCSF